MIYTFGINHDYKFSLKTTFFPHLQELRWFHGSMDEFFEGDQVQECMICGPVRANNSALNVERTNQPLRLSGCIYQVEALRTIVKNPFAKHERTFHAVTLGRITLLRE